MLIIWGHKTELIIRNEKAPNWLYTYYLLKYMWIMNLVY